MASVDASPKQKSESSQSVVAATLTADSNTSRSVLIAIDRSRHSERALRWYASKLRSPEDRVAFVNVTEPPDLAMGFGMAGAAVAEIYTKAVEETVESAKRLAINVKALSRSLGIEKIRFLERISHSPGQAIVEVSEEEQADLIVLGSRGVGLLRRTFLGSVSDYVLHHSRRAAVLVVPADVVQPGALAAATADTPAGTGSVVFIPAGTLDDGGGGNGRDGDDAADAVRVEENGGGQLKGLEVKDQ